MFERFTDQARLVLTNAREDAAALHHDVLGTEHLLLGMLRPADSGPAVLLAEAGVGYDAAKAAILAILHTPADTPAARMGAAEALAAIGVDIDEIRRRAEEAFGPGALRLPDSPRFAPRAKKVLQLALSEALRLGQLYIDAEHLLLGILMEGIPDGGGVAVRALDALGADRTALREATQHRVSPAGHRLGTVNQLISKLANRISPADEQRDRAGEILWDLRMTTQGAYHRASKSIQRINDDLAAELESALRAAREELRTAGVALSDVDSMD